MRRAIEAPIYTTQRIAAFADALPALRLPGPVMAQVANAVLDAFSAAIAAHDLDNVRAVREVAMATFARGQAPIWFTGTALGATGAAFCNASAMSALDFDDGHRGARGHPGAAIVPTALALARPGVAHRVPAAIALGYEIAIRIAMAQNGRAIRTRQSGRWTAYGVVAAAGYMRATAPQAMAHALAIAGVLSPNQEANGSSGYAALTGNDVKEGIPWSVTTGLTALQLAENGHTGPLDLLDHASHYDRAIIEAGLGRVEEITRIYFKPYACCRYIHPAIDAFADLVATYDLKPADIAAVDVETFAWALRLSNRTQPCSLQDMQYSLPFCLAIAAIDGVAALAPIARSALPRRELRDFASRVRLSVSPELDAHFPRQTLARVLVDTTGGSRLSSRVTVPRGEPCRPMSREDLAEKFLAVSRGKMEHQAQRRVLLSIEALSTGDAGPVLDCIRAPLLG